MVVDADMAGGDIASGYLGGAVSAMDGLLGLAGDRTADLAAAVWERVIALDDEGTRLLLTGISEPGQARSLVGIWSSLAEVFTQLDDEYPPVDVLLDLGRLGAAHEATILRERADMVLLVLRSSLVSIASARSAVRRLREERGVAVGSALSLGCLLVGEDQPYRASEISEGVGLAVTTTLAWDQSTAAVLSAGAPANWRFARSPLMRSARASVAAIRVERLTDDVDSGQLDWVPVTGVANRLGQRHG